MIRSTHIPAFAAAAFLAACASTAPTSSTSYVRDGTAPAGTATYSSTYAVPTSTTTTTTGTTGAASSVNPNADVNANQASTEVNSSSSNSTSTPQ